MDALTFISSLVKSLAWPVTVVGILIAIRKQVPRLVESLRKLKYKDLELDFGEATKELLLEAKDALPNQTVNSSVLPGASSASARGQVLESWLEVEDAAEKILKRHVRPGDSASPRSMIRDLVRYSILNSAQAALMDELRILRNEAAHMSSASFTPQSAADFSRVALALTEHLRREDQRSEGD